jgi:multiple sugar transport system substrate-binding protein
MHEFTRRALLQGGTALTATGMLTGPALLDFARAWAQTAPWKAEPGAKLTVMRWKRFVPAEDDAFNAMVAAFKTATGTEAPASISPGACTRCRSYSRPRSSR